MEWYLAPLRKYADFSGRARRKEYWTFTLVNSVVLGALSGIGSGQMVAAILNGTVPSFGLLMVLANLLSLALLVPGLAVAWRRLHDAGKSGAWYFMGLIPFVGWIIVLIQLCKDSVPGPNEYGPNPKEAESTANMA